MLGRKMFFFRSIDDEVHTHGKASSHIYLSVERKSFRYLFFQAVAFTLLRVIDLVLLGK
jgi:hypothetical protein